MERACAEPSDVVVLSGTLVEGIGNKHSDIDVYVVGDKLPDLERIGKRAYTGFRKWRCPGLLRLSGCRWVWLRR